MKDGLAHVQSPFVHASKRHQNPHTLHHCGVSKRSPSLRSNYSVPALLVTSVSGAHLNGTGKDVVADDLVHQVLVVQKALEVKAELGESGVDSIVGGQEECDARHLV